MKIYYSPQGKKGDIVKLEGNDKFTNGFLVFYRTALASFPYKFDNLMIGDYMCAYTGSENGTYVVGGEEDHDLYPYLESAERMFWESKVEKCEVNFPKLQKGDYMFENAKNLKSVDYQPVEEDTQTRSSNGGEAEWQLKGFDSLTSAYHMFSGTVLTSFYRDLPSLTDGSWMFYDIKTLSAVDSIGYATEDGGDGENFEIHKGRKGYDNLENGSCMFTNTSIKSFYRDLPALTDADKMFLGSNLEVFANGDMDKLQNAPQMFKGCEKLETFYSNMSSLTTFNETFTGCNELSKFYCKLSSLTDGKEGFKDLKKLNIFYSDLSSMTEGTEMFSGCSSLEYFDAKLDNLKTGTKMFFDCSSLLNFYNDLGSLETANEMFKNCEKLPYWTKELSKVSEGTEMFSGC
jgi:hypothetical protein